MVRPGAASGQVTFAGSIAIAKLRPVRLERLKSGRQVEMTLAYHGPGRWVRQRRCPNWCNARDAARGPGSAQGLQRRTGSIRAAGPRYEAWGQMIDDP